MGNEVDGLGISLRLFASPPLILSTKSVVVMEWKGTSTAIATRAAPPGLPVDPQEMQGASARPALLGSMSSD